jgi:DNA-directed RNA polymerase sigma subunit (sigma70/sigma32)
MSDYLEREKKLSPRRATEDSLAYYVRLLNRYPILSVEEENQLIENWFQNGDRQSADRVVNVTCV